MGPNPVLKKLGLADDDRAIIIHTDDIGMCQSSVAAFADLWQAGVISSGAVMIPCGWAPAAAQLANQMPEADLGIHLTITSEWDNYRWGPISTRKASSGLMDDEGFFPRTSAQVQKSAKPKAVRREMEKQITRAMSWGIVPTHIDTHMGTVAHVKFMMDYVKLALKYKLPPLIFRLDKEGWMRAHSSINEFLAEKAAQLVLNLEERGLPMLDNIASLELNADPRTRFEQAQQVFDHLPTGITHFIIHPSKETHELKAITPDWQCRVADYETFMKQEVRDYLKKIGVQVIGYRDLKNLIP
jgi:chitin disaccharide deacetylase